MNWTQVVNMWIQDEIKKLYFVQDDLENLDLGINLIKKKTRKAYDNLFWTLLPHEAIWSLMQFNIQAFTDDFKNEIMRILSKTDWEYFYNEQYLVSILVEKILENKDNRAPLVLHKNSKKDIINRHHILPSSKGWTLSPKNLKSTEVNIHSLFHILFRNLAPREQIIFILFLNNNYLNPDFVNDCAKILKEDDITYYYLKWTFDINNIKYEQFKTQQWQLVDQNPKDSQQSKISA